MDPTTVIIGTLLTSLGLSAYVPVALAVVGLASVVSTVYPQNWRGATTIHTVALLFGRAAPATPAASVTTEK